MKTRRILSALLATLLLFAAAAFAEEDFGFDFDDEGYTGEWLEVPELGIEFCLPDGWTPLEAGEDVLFAAAKDDGAATLMIGVVEEDVSDLIQWADANLAGYRVDTAGFYDTLLTEADNEVAVYRLDDDDRVVAFLFTRDSADALSADFALEIVDSVNESWIEEGELLDEDDEDDEDDDPFEAFEALIGDGD